MSFIKHWCILFLVFLLIAVMHGCAYAQVYQAKTGHAEFNSSVPLHSFVGTSDHLAGKVSLPDSTIDFYLDLTTLDTGNDKRDKDMRETLETEKYPFAEFFGKLVSGFDSTSSEPQQVRVQGEFKIHNVTKDITIDGTLQQTGEGLKVEASWILNLKDYNIEPPGILFYRVDEEIDVQIDALLKPLNK